MHGLVSAIFEYYRNLHTVHALYYAYLWLYQENITTELSMFSWTTVYMWTSLSSHWTLSLASLYAGRHRSNHRYHVKSICHQLSSRKDLQAQAKLSMASSPSEMTGTYKPGGTMMLSTGDVLARLISSGNDEVGRWSFQKFGGRHNRIVTIVVAYQTCAQLGTSKGNVTAHAQQESFLRQQNVYQAQTLAKKSKRSPIVSQRLPEFRWDKKSQDDKLSENASSEGAEATESPSRSAPTSPTNRPTVVEEPERKMTTRSQRTVNNVDNREKSGNVQRMILIEEAWAQAYTQLGTHTCRMGIKEARYSRTHYHRAKRIIKVRKFWVRMLQKSYSSNIQWISDKFGCGGRLLEGGCCCGVIII